MATLEDQRGGTRPLDIRDFIFVRELAEVYLLLDHISGRWDKPLDAEGEQLRAAVCAIGWPPNGSRPDAAEQATTLLRAKDRLNALARPASGATIAFTLLVVGEEDPRRQHRRWWRRLWRWGWPGKRRCEWRALPHGGAKSVAPPITPQGAVGAAAVDGAVAQTPIPPFTAPTNGDLIVPGCGFTRPPTRMSLARTAFPGLIGPAGHFNRGIWRIVLFLVMWMVLTCVLSWDITAGNVVLTHLDTLRTQQGELARKISSAEAADELARRSKAGPAAAVELPPVQFCEPVIPSAPRKYRTVEELQLCTDKERLENERVVTQRNLHVWIKPWEKLYRLVTFEPSPGAPPQRAGGIPDFAGPYGGDEEPARVLTHVIGCAVLPLCYGILGAGAAAVRNLWAKLRESMLMPRDYTLALGQLALGATIGACIGLFVNPSGSSSGAGAALASSWTLSGSALSFIAGFGVEGVFLALEAFVRRVFGVAGQGDGRRT
ncbi:hypothetical protein GJ700_13415 [Duganella sp. FT92W]|uniref:Uncharacterized protein n=1 Tax=Pseudoduganella rivuli TaxID=2666085 RepID=A0A7X2LU68_9BURK|nr:hypothetical protein [Pseudoduganella rivuli]MRV72707.1 hypothetical protein [Pseudoduganella rivuli]